MRKVALDTQKFEALSQFLVVFLSGADKYARPLPSRLPVTSACHEREGHTSAGNSRDTTRPDIAATVCHQDANGYVALTVITTVSAAFRVVRTAAACYLVSSHQSRLKHRCNRHWRGHPR